MNTKNTYTFSKGKLTLLDFWEVWCGPCVKSLPEVQKLKNKYSTRIDIIGIVSKDIPSSKILLAKKGITYKNLIGNDDILEKYHVNSFPRYFLIDRNGIVRRQYFGFEFETIESDINELLKN